MNTYNLNMLFDYRIKENEIHIYPNDNPILFFPFFFIASLFFPLSYYFYFFFILSLFSSFLIKAQCFDFYNLYQIINNMESIKKIIL